MNPVRRRRPGPSRGPRVYGIGELLTRHPRLVLGAWIVLVAVLAFVGRNLPDQLESHPLYIEGSEPAKAREISLRQFGSDERLIILPAVMKGLGQWSWWMPSWLDRLLPGTGAPAKR